ncbi:hypothetical protein OWM54_10880 [Myxococcus sp. MISCRS1]|uniref:hypothetical protein n=1 Tax=Myxococcus sp. MISCRS1 TaxID=2996786 RepID=UPI00226FC906|nr:hypothetical protein [Myxococcus sp. MISCRS1]MCY0997641.1 hypothetical protein [Myxococcus sp. MISCRS1]
MLQATICTWSTNSPEVSKAYFGEKSLSLLEYFSFNGMLSDGKSIGAKLIGFRIFDNLQLGIYTAITDDKTTVRNDDSPDETAKESNLENFIESVGNLTLTAELPLMAIIPPSPAAGAGLRSIASMSVMGLINADVEPLGVSSDNGVRVSQLGLRFYGQKAAIDDGNVAAFAEANMGGLWGTADFFSSIGQPGRRVALYGKATVGLLLFRRFRLNLNKVIMGPEKMRWPWILSVAVAPFAP